MIATKFDFDGKFSKEMNNLVKYSLGFIEGTNLGKQVFFATVGEKTKEIFGLFLDSMARQSPATLHHVYEWYETGSPGGRLFDIDYTVSNLGLSLKSTFRQSTSIQKGSRTPFYNKASMMEAGVSVTIRPREAEVLVFQDGADTVFTKGPVNVTNPGGAQVQGSFQAAFDTFVNSYFTQAFMQTIGINQKFGNLVTYKKNLPAGLKAGRGPGVAAGYRWIVNLGVGA